MNDNLNDFCPHEPSAYLLLQQNILQCAQSHHSYEFHHCQMPPGCTPAQSTLGFCLAHGTYYIYLDPPVSYCGSSRTLQDFFHTSFHTFSTFTQLTAQMIQLGEALTHPETGQDSHLPPLFQQLYEAFSSHIFGQPHAIEGVAFKLYSHITKTAPRRPLSLIFYGPTGVGKSELGKAIAPVLNQCQGRYQTVWTELNTFTEAHSVYRLTGAPPGYVGYEDQPVLEAVRHNDHTVFMFDELEKAHPEVLKVFMSILDEGRCTAHRRDSSGDWELDFRHCIFVFTTNADLSRPRARKLGFTPSAPPSPLHLTPVTHTPYSNLSQLAQRLYQEDESARQSLIQQGVLREIAGRFSGLIGFTDLAQSDRVAVTAKQISALGLEHGIMITGVGLELAQALTPEHSVSPRSTVGILEGILTPVFLSCSSPAPCQRVRLVGSLEHMQLVPDLLPVP